MRIQGPSIGQVIAGAAERGRTGATRDDGDGDSDGASVSLSSSAQALSGSDERGRAARAEKVAALRQAVAGGQSRVDRGAVADKMADEELARAGVS
jgi:flagellar biosynthesis anti-sigma factor FlgM